MVLLNGVSWLIAFQIVGSLIGAGLGLVVPGPIIGLMLLLAYLMRTGDISAPLESAAGQLLRYMPLLLVPAAVGVMAHAQVIARQFWPLLATLVLSLLPALAFAGWLMQWLVRRQARGEA